MLSSLSFGDNHLRAVWRISLGLGVIPALAVLIWRLSMEEPARYKKDSMKNAKIPYLLIIKRYGVSLAAISFTWYEKPIVLSCVLFTDTDNDRFLYDFIVYPVRADDNLESC